jgi:membrane-bound lytic murein transglycosylase B
MRRAPIFLLWCACTSWAGPALAASCEDAGGFEAWLDTFKQEAAAQGISQPTIASALAGVTYEAQVYARTVAYFATRLAGTP